MSLRTVCRIPLDHAGDYIPMFPRRMFALLDSALLFIRSALVSIGAGLFGLLLDADRKAVPVSPASNPRRHGTQRHPYKLFRPTRRARSG